jgi:hypothetical protein
MAGIPQYIVSNDRPKVIVWRGPTQFMHHLGNPNRGVLAGETPLRQQLVGPFGRSAMFGFHLRMGDITLT